MVNSVELLLDLGVDSNTSKANIERAINSIKNQLGQQLNVTLNVNTGGSSNSIKQVSDASKAAKQSVDGLTESLSRTERGSRSLENANNRAIDTLRRVGREGSLSADRLGEFERQISEINAQPITITQKINQLRTATRALNTEFQDAANTNRLTSQFGRAENQVERLRAQLVRLQQQYGRGLNQNLLGSLQGQLGNIRVPNFTDQTGVREFNSQLNNIGSQVNRLGAEAARASRSAQGVLQNFGEAIKRYPTYIAASTAFFATFRGIADITKQVIELDTALTNIRRVLDEPNYRFNEILQESISNVRELSGVLSDYLGLVEDFSRQGFSGDEALNLATTTQTLQNISDLTAQESLDALVASQIAFNIAAEDSIQIADQLNEVN